MSWDQGVQLAEELPKSFVDMIEKRYYDMFGEEQKLEYITWFGLGETFFADFGIDAEHSLELKLKETNNGKD